MGKITAVQYSGASFLPSECQSVFRQSGPPLHLDGLQTFYLDVKRPETHFRTHNEYNDAFSLLSALRAVDIFCHGEAKVVGLGCILSPL